MAEVTAREATLQAQLDRQKQGLSQSKQSSVEMTALETRAQSLRSVVDAFYARMREAASEADAEVVKPGARVISAAEAPVLPAVPHLGLLAIVAVAAGGCLGLVLIVLVDQLDKQFKSWNDVEDETGLPVLGAVPRLRPRDFLTQQPTLEGVLYRTGFISSSIQNLTSFQYPKRVLVTSATFAEGKTTTALIIARQFAARGQRTLVLECDLYQRALAKRAGVSRAPGWTEFTRGLAREVDILQKDSASDALVVVAGGIPGYPTEFLRDKRFTDLLGTLDNLVDVIIVDTPPVLVSVDACLLSKVVDAVLVVVRGDTERGAVVAALGELDQAGTKVAGVILSMVKRRPLRKYGANGAYASPRPDVSAPLDRRA